MTCMLNLGQRKEKMIHTHKITMASKRKTRDLSHTRCINNEDERVLTQDGDIMNRLREHVFTLQTSY